MINPGEARTLRESMGLSPKWIAGALGLSSDRHIREIEAGRAAVTMKLAEKLHELEKKFEDLVDESLAKIFDSLGIDLVDDDYLEQLDQADWPTIVVPLKDDPADTFPATWYRAIAAHVRWELNGCCWIEYED